MESNNNDHSYIGMTVGMRKYRLNRVGEMLLF